MRAAVRSLLYFWAVASVSAQQTAATRQTVEVEFALTQGSTGRSITSPREGDDVRVRFKVRDKTSRTPLENRYPSSWMELNASGAEPPGVSCKTRVQRILNADLFSRPEIDLNIYYVLVLNRDASVTVVDPVF